MAHTACEIIWLKNLLQDFKIPCTNPMAMFCDNQVVIFIARNSVFYERTKNIEVDCYFIYLPYTRSEDELADIFTKAPRPIYFS